MYRQIDPFRNLQQSTNFVSFFFLCKFSHRILLFTALFPLINLPIVAHEQFEIVDSTIFLPTVIFDVHLPMLKCFCNGMFQYTYIAGNFIKQYQPSMHTKCILICISLDWKLFEIQRKKENVNTLGWDGVIFSILVLFSERKKVSEINSLIFA